MKISKRMWKHFNLKMKPEVTKWRKSHTHKPWREPNLRELRDWFPCKYLIYRRPILISWQMKTIQESLPVHSQASQLTAWTLARPPLFALKVKSESRSVVSNSLFGQSMEFSIPWILEWVAFSFSQPRDQTQVSRIAGRFFTSWATREAHSLPLNTAHPKLWTDLPAACYSKCSLKCNSSAIPEWMQFLVIWACLLCR